MRKNGSDRIVLFLISVMLYQSMAYAQWREVPVPGNGSFQDGQMFDDGYGVLISDSSGVFTTQDEWETSNLVTAPNMGLDERFIPREVDTNSAGVLVVIGHVVNDGAMSIISTTYSMLSRDHGNSWEEFGERLPGRFISLSFSGMKFGLVAHEHYEQRGSRSLYALTIRRYDLDFNVIRVDTLDSMQERIAFCYNYVDYRSTKITLIDSATILVHQRHPCVIDRELAGWPEIRYWATLFISRDAGSTFSVSDSTRNAYSYMAYSPNVISSRKWTGLSGRSSVDEGLTWQELFCTIQGLDSQGLDSLITVNLGSIRIVKTQLNTFEFWDARQLVNPKRWVIRTAIADFDKCTIVWDTQDFTFEIGDYIYTSQSGAIPYSGNSKVMLSFETGYFNPKKETNHLLIYNRAGSVDVESDPNEGCASFNVVYSDDHLRVRTTSKFQMPYTLHILDLTGRLISQERITSQDVTVNAEALVQGTFVVVAQDESGYVESAIISVIP